MQQVGPTAIITKYALVRASKEASTERLATGYAQRPHGETELWNAFALLLREAAPSERFLQAATAYLDATALDFRIQGIDLADAVERDTEQLSSVLRGEGTSSIVELIRTKYSPLFADDAKKEQMRTFELSLWDHIAASSIVGQHGFPLSIIIVILQVLHTARYLSSITPKTIPEPAALSPDILFPEDLKSFIRRARKDRRERIVAARNEALSAAQGRTIERITHLLATAATHQFLSRALNSRGLLLRDANRIDVTDAASPDSRQLANPEGLKAILSPALLEAAHPEILRFISDVLMEDPRVADVTALAERGRQHLTGLVNEACRGLSARQIVQISSELDQCAALACTDKAADLRQLASTLLKRFALVGWTFTSHSPLPHEPGRVKPAGFGDLRIVRQQLQKYELGEVAYVENVLAGEERSRIHVRRERTEQQTISETEEESEVERDLQSTERFQLSQELESIQKESRATEAGVNVSASYGAVSVAAHAQTQSAESAEQAQRNARNYIKETVSKAVQRLQKRVRLQKMTTFIAETKEINKHSFSAAGSDSRVGVYRYIEKHYFCQTVNYGSRLMMEFWVPEPAAYLTYAEQGVAQSGVQLIAPEKPTINPASITDTNYQALAAQYNAEVNEPPPAAFFGAPMQINKSSQNASSESFSVPDHYEVTRAYCKYVFVQPRGQTPSGSLTWFVGRNIWDTDYFSEMQYVYPPLRGGVTVRVMTYQTVNDWLIGISLFLSRTREAYEKWQLETYNSIMLAYKLAKEEYDRRVAEADQNKRDQLLRSDVGYRTIERNELRRASLELLTNQHFDDFGSIDIISKVPTINNGNAEVEGPIVRFFEHGFEWDNMVYTFYPYFWSRKGSWPSRLSITDADPLHQRFLEAGFARVVVPVRKGYEKHISAYVATGDLWPDGNMPTIGDADYVAIIDEIKANDAALGATLDGDGIAEGAPWTVVLPTPLVCLETDKLKLPNWEIKPPGKPIPYVPSEALCDGMPYNAAQWPDAASIRLELKVLGYGVSESGNPDAYLRSAEGVRIVRAFQRRCNELGLSARLGRPLRIDGAVGPCTLRVLSVAADERMRGEWPGPGIS